MDNKNIWVKFEDHCLNEGLSKKRIKKLRVMFNVLDRNIRKPLSSLQRPDIEKFVNSLNRNEVKTIKGEEFSGTSKSDVKKFLKQFYKWYSGNNEFYPPEVAWIKAKISKDERPDEKEILQLREVQKLAAAFDKIELRALVLLLFDSGFRISEMLSVTKNNLTWDSYDKDKSCFWIKCSESKTITRKIPIPLFTEDITRFMHSSYFEALEDEERIFQKSYNYYWKILQAAFKKVFPNKKRIGFHSLRHSSATYYAQVLGGDLFALCQRFGWGFDSDEAKTYVRKSGEFNKIAPKKVFESELSDIKRELAELDSRNKAQEKQIKDLTASYIDLLNAIPKISVKDEKTKKIIKDIIKGLKN